MSLREITCEIVDEGDLDTRYLAGRLSGDQAEAFEAHFFACEQCWGLVQQGLAVRSSYEPAASPAGSAIRPHPRRRWWALAAAASIAVAVVGIWRLDDRGGQAAEDAYRGSADSFTVSAGAGPAELRAAWTRHSGADIYRVRLYHADGTLVLQRETTDTSVTIPMDSVAARRGAQLFWQVQALDRLRSPVAASELTATLLPSPAP